MSDTASIRWRRRRPIVAAVAMLALVPATWGLHSFYPGAPLWMIVPIALIPAFVVTERCIAVADRFGWLPAAITSLQRRRLRRNRILPKWVYTVESFANAIVTVWFGIPMSDRWHHMYPTLPAWMPFLSMCVLWSLGLGVVEETLNALLKLGWSEAPDAVSEDDAVLDGSGRG